MENESNAYSLPVREMEFDILQFIDESSEFRRLDGNLSANERLKRKYKSQREQEQLRVMMDFLEDERFLYRYSGPYQGRGITPKGLDRLYRLEHTYLSFVKDNWFKLFVAAPAALASIAIAANTILN